MKECRNRKTMTGGCVCRERLSKKIIEKATRSKIRLPEWTSNDDIRDTQRRWSPDLEWKGE